MKCRVCEKEGATLDGVCKACLDKDFKNEWDAMKALGYIEITPGYENLPAERQNYRLTEKGRSVSDDELESTITEYRGKMMTQGEAHSDAFWKEREAELRQGGHSPEEARRMIEKVKSLGVGESEAVTLRVMKRANVPEYHQYAYDKTGIMLTEMNQKYYTPKEKREWQAAAREWDKLTEEERQAWRQKIDEYPEEPAKAAKEILTEEQWVLINKLENGETAVFEKRGYIDVQTAEQARDFLKLNLVKADTGYLPDGSMYGSADVLGKEIIRVVGKESVPRSDYDPKKHDTFHLRVNRDLEKTRLRAGVDAMDAAGLCVDEHHVDSAFDVIEKLCKLLQMGHHWDALTTLQKAQPIVWMPNMMLTAGHAVDSLHDSLSVEADMVSLNPNVWLFAGCFFNKERADKAVWPVTGDGHVPFSDEMVGDPGFALAGELFSLTKTEITAYYLHWDLSASRLKLRVAHLPLGTEPKLPEEQATLRYLRFAASPYLIVQRYGVQRHIRRRVEGRLPAVSQGVGVILLRRSVSVSGGKPSEGESEIEWSCQWWVSGHWCHQVYGPSHSQRKLIWIAPYIKGPPDKPLKEAVRLLVR